LKEITMRYCPIARHFYRIRRVLIEELGLPRQAIRPSATFAELVPREHRRRVWGRFRRDKVKVNGLWMSQFQMGLICASMSGSGLMVLAVLPHSWFCMATAIFAGVAAYLALAPWAKEVDPSCTLGDAALNMTSVRECREAGYQFTRNEIFVKVRSAISVSLGVPISQINRETTWAELGAE
jgi:hypothetical protein